MISACYFLIRDIKMHLKNDVNYQKFVFDVISRVLCADHTVRITKKDTIC